MRTIYEVIVGALVFISIDRLARVISSNMVEWDFNEIKLPDSSIISNIVTDVKAILSFTLASIIVISLPGSIYFISLEIVEFP